MRTITIVLFLVAIAGPTSVARSQVKLVDVSSAKGLSSVDSVPGDGHAPGAVFTDLNDDGYPDIYVMGSRDWDQGVMLPNRLFLNTDVGSGNRTYVEVAGAAGADDVGAHNGVLSADYDNDGDQDLYVINWYQQDDPTASQANDKNRLYRNNLVETSQLSFTDITDSTDPTPSESDDQHGVLSAPAEHYLVKIGSQIQTRERREIFHRLERPAVLVLVIEQVQDDWVVADAGDVDVPHSIQIRGKQTQQCLIRIDRLDGAGETGHNRNGEGDHEHTDKHFHDLDL